METILEFVEKYNYPERDNKVIDFISKYYAQNNEALLDGLIEHKVVFGSILSGRLLDIYRIPDREWNKFKTKNPTLAKDRKVSGKLEHIVLMASFFNTQNRMFLEFLALIMYGARYSRYFSKGVKVGVMKYVVEQELTNKSLFKRHGSVFIVIQETIDTLLTDNKDTKIRAAFDKRDDISLSEIINSIYKRVNSLIGYIANYYYDVDKKKESSYIMLVNDQAEEGRLSLSNNSVKINNLKSMIDNYRPSSLDEMIVKTLRVEDPLRLGALLSLLVDKDRNYFKIYGNEYVDYFVKQYGSDIRTMNRTFIQRATTARMKSDLLKKLDKDMYSDIKNYTRYWTKKTGTKITDEMARNVGILKLVRIFKDYVIIKIRHMMNDI